MSLLVGKSKIACCQVLKRLELTAAVQLSRLIEFVRTSLNLTTALCHCWTDSTVVLAWVRQHPSKWKTFVSNRVADIQGRIPEASWRHISTAENPADCASCGIPGSQLMQLIVYGGTARYGYVFPNRSGQLSQRARVPRNNRLNTHNAKLIELWDLAIRYSSWSKLIRVTA